MEARNGWKNGSRESRTMGTLKPKRSRDEKEQKRKNISSKNKNEKQREFSTNAPLGSFFSESFGMILHCLLGRTYA